MCDYRRIQRLGLLLMKSSFLFLHRYSAGSQSTSSADASPFSVARGRSQARPRTLPLNEKHVPRRLRRCWFAPTEAFSKTSAASNPWRTRWYHCSSSIPVCFARPCLQDWKRLLPVGSVVGAVALRRGTSQGRPSWPGWCSNAYFTSSAWSWSSVPCASGIGDPSAQPGRS